jgi:HPt (histidine-containing phosphotransfer) domain-containing protein
MESNRFTGRLFMGFQKDASGAISDQGYVETDPQLRPFLPKYLQNRQRDLDCLTRYLAAGDFESIKFTSHKIKGHAKSYGFPTLGEISGAMEKAAEKKDGALVSSLLEAFENSLRRIKIVD